jgi:pyruvate/2-oxoglutarate dehydrogenase complex dihydrolipoamide dehydrogenase (E3) component
MDFDVIVIGSGQAGVPLATRLARGGKAVLLAERAELGGTCTNIGCTPTNTLLANARAAHVARTGARLGIRAESVHAAFPAIMARKDQAGATARALVEMEAVHPSLAEGVQTVMMAWPRYALS